jgi:hypothetical protein
MPVVKYYQKSGVVYDIPASGSKDEVYVQVRKAVDEILPSAAAAPAPAPVAASASTTTTTTTASTEQHPGMVHLGPIA